ncbi:MAG: hypothetical protein R3E31_21160 [Chloroflexota bacterium]
MEVAGCHSFCPRRMDAPSQRRVLPHLWGALPLTLPGEPVDVDDTNPISKLTGGLVQSARLNNPSDEAIDGSV